MPFNQDTLSLVALGIQGDSPVDTPALPDGIHLRWAPDPAIGFPWYGFYLFRRETRPLRPRCLSPELRRFRPGPSQSLALATALGRLSSARPLVLTDDFPAPGVVEVDLRPAALRFDLPAGVTARRVDVSLGLRNAGPQTVRTCIDFRGLPLGVSPSPRTEKGVVFASEPPKVSPAIAVTAIEQWPGSPPGLQTTPHLTIALPCPALSVELLLTNRGELTIEGRSADGASTGAQTVKAQALSAGTVTLTGKAITQVVLSSPTVDPALLHQICFVCPAGPAGGPAKGPDVEIRALAEIAVVAHTVVQGNAGQVVAATLEGVGITAVEIASGNAALVDLCVWPAEQGVTFGWDPVPGFQYPLCLPVSAPGYPCPGAPASPADAQALAFSRVTYQAPMGWDSDFPHLHDELTLLVQGGPTAGSMASREHPVLAGQPVGPATEADSPTLPHLRPLELLLLASLQPAFAQMLGLYFADTSVAMGVPYDYLLLVDPTGVLGGTVETALAWLAFSADPQAVDAVLVTGQSKVMRAAIAPPAAGEAYALPGPAVRRELDGSLPVVAGQVGLGWPLPPASAVASPDQLVFYLPRRADLGLLASPPGTPPADGDYLPLPGLSTLLVSTPDPADSPNSRSSDWPTPDLPVYLVDGNLAEGWYSYRFAGQDLFGRRSPLGPPAAWYQWDPPPHDPPLPLPWYYDTAHPGHHPVHSFAVALLDKLAPPPPLGVEAWALDPPDHWVLMDDAYTTWRNAHPSLVGLRVRWRWTYLQQLQAPDTREFRVYYRAGRWNALLGKVVSVAPASDAAGRSDVILDFADSHPADAFAGARLRVGNADFAILDSQPGAHLGLQVANLGAHQDVPPTAGKPCTVAIPETHPLWIDPAVATHWSLRLAVVPYASPARVVFDPVKDKNDQLLASDNPTFQGVQVSVAGPDVLFGPGPDLSALQPWVDHLWLRSGSAEEAHRIVRYGNGARRVTLETAPSLASPFAAWALGRPTREYEVFLPAPDVGPGHPFEPSYEEPAVYAQIGVSAADDKPHVADAAQWNGPPLGGRPGNESRLSPSATVYRVLQAQPDPPDLADPSEFRYATPADYHSRSYSTFRFRDPQKPLRVHILRAVEDSLFRRDWQIRETRAALNPADPPPPTEDQPNPPPNPHLAYFPAGWDVGQRQAVATVLNGLNDLTVLNTTQTPAAYAALSDDAWTILARLPGNEGFAGTADPLQFPIPSLSERDWRVRRARTTLLADESGLFPASWSPTQKANAAANLAEIADIGSYSTRTNNALQLLAGLPGNETAFTQVTLAPLERNDPALTEERRPDDDAGYSSAGSGVRAYTDTLPGRATNRYFYRARFVDGAQNQGILSLAGPVVYLRKVEPPRAPVITKVVGGDKKITLYWEPNPEPDVQEYQVYRSGSAQDADDVRTMTLVHSESAVANPPERPHWTDDPVRGRTTFFYRVLAKSSAGFFSPPSAVVRAQAYDQTPPEPPPWVSGAWRSDGSGIELQWAPVPADLAVLVLRSLGGFWVSVSPWLLPGGTQFVDTSAPAGQDNHFRLRVKNASGTVNTHFLEIAVAPL